MPAELLSAKDNAQRSKGRDSLRGWRVPLLASSVGGECGAWLEMNEKPKRANRMWEARMAFSGRGAGWNIGQSVSGRPATASGRATYSLHARAGRSGERASFAPRGGLGVAWGS